MRTVALDLGSKISYCEVNNGKVVERHTVTGLAALSQWLGPNTRRAQVAFEACREAWAVHDQLVKWGHVPLMIDTTRVKQLGIGQHRRKTDRLDAEALALALEIGRVPLAHVLSPHRRQLRLQLSVRRALVETRAHYVTSIRSLVRSAGKRLPSCASEDFAAHLSTFALDEETQRLVAPLAAILQGLNPQIQLVETKLAQLCAEEPTAARLCTAPGVGPIVSAAFVSVIDEAGRFRGAHEVESYLGLVPSEDTSGKRKLGAISKQGNSYARAMLVQAAWCILRLRGDDPLKRWGEAVAQRRSKRVAVVAIARRLAGVLWAMWRDGTTYSATKAGFASARGIAKRSRELDREAGDLRHAAAPTSNKRRSSKGNVIVPTNPRRRTAPAFNDSTREEA